MTPPDATAPGGDNDRVLRAIDRLDERLRNLQEQIGNRFEGLSERFMPRPELMNRLNEVTELRSGLQHLEDELAAAEQRRVTDRRWTVGALTASIVPLISLLTVILTHWK